MDEGRTGLRLSLTAGMDRFLSMGKGKSIFLSLRVHEEEKERRRPKLGFPSDTMTTVVGIMIVFY